jgi:hypothetical protein
MSIFRVFRLPNDYTLDNQVNGLEIAASNFNTYFVPGDPDKTFEDFIYALINNHHCTITYMQDDADHTVTTVPTTPWPLPSGTKPKFFFIKGGVKTKINPQGVQDDEYDSRVKMCIPFHGVDPTAQYLTDALGVLENTKIPAPKRKAFLLGMLLLKRCR